MNQVVESMSSLNKEEYGLVMWYELQKLTSFWLEILKE